MRITYFGAAFLAVIAVIPSCSRPYALGISWTSLELPGRHGPADRGERLAGPGPAIEANLVMRNYEGFSASGRIKGAYA